MPSHTSIECLIGHLRRSQTESLPISRYSTHRTRQWIDIDRAARETVRDSIYIRNYYPSLIAEQLRKETIGYITDLPLIGKVLQFLGSKDPTSKAKHRHVQRRGHAGRGGAHQSEEGYKKYLPYVRIAWDFLRPTLVALAIGKVQDGILGLFLGKKSRKK